MSDAAAAVGPLREAVAVALDEDLGVLGDLTSQAVIPEDALGTGHFVAREEGVLAGTQAVHEVYRPADGQPEGPKDWRPMRKGIADLGQRGAVSQAANERYLGALAAVHGGAQLRELVESHGFSIANFTYRVEAERVRRHSMVIRSADRSGAGRLSVTLEGMEAVLEFRIAPTGD